MNDANRSDQAAAKAARSNLIKRRLIWLGITLAILAALEVSDLVMRVAHPSF